MGRLHHRWLIDHPIRLRYPRDVGVFDRFAYIRVMTADNRGIRPPAPPAGRSRARGRRRLIDGLLCCLPLVLSAHGLVTNAAAAAQEPVIAADVSVAIEQSATLANWMQPPFNRWSLQHVPQILPTAVVRRNDRLSSVLPRDIRGLGAVRFASAADRTQSISEWLDASGTDGFIVLQDGRIVFEAYRNDMGPQTRHLSFSVTKSVIGVLAGILVDGGDLDPARDVVSYVPELRGSGFAGYTVRELLDMQAAIDWHEDYADPNGAWRRWKVAIGWLPGEGSANVEPVGNFGFLPSLQRDSAGTGGFRYVSPAADVVGWVLERAGGLPLAELLSRKLWAPLGAADDAYIMTDRSGAAAAAGGFGATLRDLARFGQMVLDEGRVDGRRIVSREWIADIRFNGDNAAWRGGQYRGRWNPDGAYRSFWYVSGDADGSLEAIGIHGQRLIVNPAKRRVIVRLSSGPDAVSRADYDLGSRVIAALDTALEAMPSR